MTNIISFQILGFSGGIPTKDRITSCTIISTDNGNIMIDCGEGAYRKYIQNGYELGMLKNIFITHMHPDHISGLVPILFYKNISNNISDITIVAPAKVKSLIEFTLREQGVKLKYKCIFHDVENKQYLSIKDIRINWLLLEHKIPSWGYRIKDSSGSIVFITDSRICDNSFKLAKNASVLIHEATFDNSRKSIAYNKFHCAPEDVISLAKSSLVRRLFLTHFSIDLSIEYLKNISYNGKKCVIFDKIQYL